MDQNLSDIITVFNPDNEPFEVIYDNKSYGMINPGFARRFPRYLARLAVKHLIDRLIIKEYAGNHAVSDITEREKWGKKIVIDEEVMFQAAEKSETQKLQDEVERLNKGSDLDIILARHKSTSQPAFVNENGKTSFTPPSDITAPMTPPAPTPPIPQAPDATATILPSAEESDAQRAVEATPPVQPIIAQTPPPVDNGETLAPSGIPPAAPTREQIYTFAKTTLMMDLSDQKTMASLEAMSVPELVDQLKYEAN